MELSVLFKGSRVCLQQERVLGVFLSNAVVKPRNWTVFVGLINVNEEKINLRKFRPEFGHLSDCKLWRWREIGIRQINMSRLRQLKEMLELSNTRNQEERGSITHLCLKYNDISHPYLSDYAKIFGI